MSSPVSLYLFVLGSLGFSAYTISKDIPDEALPKEPVIETQAAQELVLNIEQVATQEEIAPPASPWPLSNIDTPPPVRSGVQESYIKERLLPFVQHDSCDYMETDKTKVIVCEYNYYQCMGLVSEVHRLVKSSYLDHEPYLKLAYLDIKHDAVKFSISCHPQLMSMIEVKR